MKVRITWKSRDPFNRKIVGKYVDWEMDDSLPYALLEGFAKRGTPHNLFLFEIRIDGKPHYYDIHGNIATTQV